jgi:hypothetical protein
VQGHDELFDEGHGARIPCRSSHPDSDSRADLRAAAADSDEEDKLSGYAAAIKWFFDRAS